MAEYMDKDFLDNKINIGDEVIFEAPGYRSFVIGKVVTKAPKSCQIEYVNNWNYPNGRTEIVRQCYGQIIKHLTYCPNCGTKMISESVGWQCPKCKGFVSMDGIFHEHKETPFMPPKTNYDVITSKSLERLAEFLIWICHEPIFSDFTKEDWIEELSKESD